MPKPFRSFSVRSEQPRHALLARAPYGCVHVVHTQFLTAAAMARLAADGLARIPAADAFDIAHARLQPHELRALAGDAGNPLQHIAAAVHSTGVLGDDIAGCERSIGARIDYLSTRGAGFHNDVSRHWPACLFWNLAIVAADVEFVMPHAQVRVALRPGDLIVFDQTMAHGLCRPADQGQAVDTSFTGADARQLFLTGELPLTDAQWAALGCPWLAVEEHHRRGALDLLAATFDERSGAIQGLRGLADSMLPSTCYADKPAAT